MNVPRRVDLKPTERFSNRVDNYRRFRPGYPAAVVDLIRRSAGLSAGDAVADIGSGTGIFTRLLLEAGYDVFAVEPNEPMRAIAEQDLANFRSFHSLPVTAEHTGLAKQSVRAITAAQAFHWFDRPAAQSEFRRILVPRGWFFLIGNERKGAASPFQESYNELMKTLGPAYENVRARPASVDPGIEQFFAASRMQFAQFENPQPMNWEGLLGRFLSSSYAPLEGDPRHGPMVTALEDAFRANERDGRIVYEQRTHVYFGQL